MARACEFKGETVERLIAESNKALRDNGFSFDPDKILFKQIPVAYGNAGFYGAAGLMEAAMTCGKNDIMLKIQDKTGDVHLKISGVTYIGDSPQPATITWKIKAGVVERLVVKERKGYCARVQEGLRGHCTPQYPQPELTDKDKFVLLWEKAWKRVTDEQPHLVGNEADTRDCILSCGFTMGELIEKSKEWDVNKFVKFIYNIYDTTNAVYLAYDRLTNNSRNRNDILHKMKSEGWTTERIYKEKLTESQIYEIAKDLLDKEKSKPKRVFRGFKK